MITIPLEGVDDDGRDLEKMDGFELEGVDDMDPNIVLSLSVLGDANPFPYSEHCNGKYTSSSVQNAKETTINLEKELVFR